MPRATGITIAALTLLLLGACSGYRELPRPWRSDPTDREFATVSVLHVGDRMRLTAANGTITEGILVAFDGLEVTLADTAGGAHLSTTPVDGIVRLEVFQSGLSDRTVRNVVIAGGMSVIVYSVVTSASNRGRFRPDAFDVK